jgi:hypothetical protein
MTATFIRLEPVRLNGPNSSFRTIATRTAFRVENHRWTSLTVSLGRKKLVEIFGYWPSFHDAEVVWMMLDRRPQGDDFGPTLETLIHVFEITSEIGPDGAYVLRHHVLVHLRFRDFVELRLEDFNHQNALFGLRISDVRGRQLEHIHFEVRFDSSHGAEVSFQCYAVEVVAVTACTKDGEPVST